MSEILNEVGQVYKDFELLNLTPIHELKSTLRELIHLPSNAHILHIANQDPENVFCLSFRTLPNSSNGTPHILEHTVLCGSQKFPVKDPFFAMNRRSLNTYMNALTGSDFTCYPAASQVPKDFYNLLEVYLDAVFKPKLSKLSFLQEGHRLEFTHPSDPSTPLAYRGIVFNEMKGSLASGEARIWKSLMHQLFPDVSYGYNSGGDPSEIPNLSYEELLEFHRTYYHPSHCLFYFYGNLPLKDHLDFLSEHAFHGVKKVPLLPPLPCQPRLTAPVRSIQSYPITSSEELNQKSIFGIGWLTCHILQQKEWLALQVLDLILMGTDAAPLKHAFLRSGLCTQADSYIDSDTNEVPFILIFKGCEEQNIQALSELTLKTLEQIAQDKIPSKWIESAIHQLEFSRSEITGSHTPFGLTLFMRSALLKQHGVKPEEGLRLHTLFETLRSCTEDPDYLPYLIKKYFLHNTHRVEIVMNPSSTLAQKELDKENHILEGIKSQLSEADTNFLVQQAKELADFQEAQEKEDLEVLPKVLLSDVNSHARDYVLSHEYFSGINVYLHDCFTNQIIYADILFDLPNIREEELPYVRLFSSLLPEMGCGGRTYNANLEYIQEHTGGISTSLFLHLQADNFHSFKPALGLRGKALYRKIDKLFPLLKDMILSADFTDIPRLKELLLQHHTSLEQSLNHNALKYAINLSSSHISSASLITNYWYGLEYLSTIRELVKDFDERADQFVERLQELQQRLLGLQGADLVLGCDKTTYELLKREGFFGLYTVSQKPFIPWKENFPVQPITSQGRVIASPVAFTALTLFSPSYTHIHAPLLSLAAHLFENKILHKRIREQGGAYGGGASNNPMSGQFSFYGYRDPHIVSTIQAFKEAVHEISEGHFNERDLEEAKIGILQGLDAPIAPGHRAMLAYSWLSTNKELPVRQMFRDRLLKATKEEVKAAVQLQLVPQLATAPYVSFAGQELLDKENQRFKELELPQLPVFKV